MIKYFCMYLKIGNVTENDGFFAVQNNFSREYFAYLRNFGILQYFGYALQKLGGMNYEMSVLRF